jgi:hypothetical protein
VILRGIPNPTDQCYIVAMLHRALMLAATVMFALSAFFVSRSSLHDQDVEPRKRDEVSLNRFGIPKSVDF